MSSILECKVSIVYETGYIQVVREEVEDFLRTLRGGKSPGPDNILAGLLKHDCPEMLKVICTLGQKIQ